jgi:arylsulfatase A-like enzyme
MPGAKFKGITRMGPRGDEIAEVDWMTGEAMKALQKWGLANNTLVIFSSDNGPVLNDGYDDKAVQLLGDHRPAGIYKGGKYSAYEGGTRVPFIVTWPGQIQPAESNALVSQVDLMASLSDLVGVKINQRIAAPDSKHLLPVLLGKSREGRKELLEESFTMSLRYGDWKYIDAVKNKTPDWLRNKDVPTGLQASPQLFNLEDDPGENHNLLDQYPDMAKKMSVDLKKVMEKR